MTWTALEWSMDEADVHGTGVQMCIGQACMKQSAGMGPSAAVVVSRARVFRVVVGNGELTNS